MKLPDQTRRPTSREPLPTRCADAPRPRLALPQLPVIRRSALRVAAGAGVVAATAGTVSIVRGCSAPGGNDGSPTVVDATRADYVIDPKTNESRYDVVDLPLAERSSWTLGLGNVLHPGEGTWLPVTTAGSSAAPMVKGSALSTADGTLREVVAEPLSSDKTSFVIYDVRCSDAVYAWVELDLLTHAWVLYASAFAGGALAGSPTKLWEAGADYDPAPFAVAGTKVIWQVMPALSGSKTTEHSYCYVWSLGSGEAKSVVESPGRFATEPLASGGTVTLVPRVNAEAGVYYGITAYTLSDDLATQVDRLVLPATVRPLNAVRIGDEFAFSIEATYASGGLLGTMGTYVGHGDGPFVALSREPAAAVAGRGRTYVIRASSSYFVVDAGSRTYSTLSAANRCINYGEYPARAGECDSFVTFSTIKAQDTGYPESVNVRSFSFGS
ncbi:Tat pathway signal protein [Olsenella massiliensis]|uniref:Tat pathway signal protein n=1 Tax=Olsenella massiliensis TaxID=1622075 RepID=UPI000ABD09C0|nr:Tat pathway signal protein [Olsenella massiliensis]